MKAALARAISGYDETDSSYKFSDLLELTKEHQADVLRAMGLVCWLRHTHTRTPDPWELKVFDEIADLLAGIRFSFEVTEETLENVGVSSEDAA